MGEQPPSLFQVARTKIATMLLYPKGRDKYLLHPLLSPYPKGVSVFRPVAWVVPSGLQELVEGSLVKAMSLLDGTLLGCCFCHILVGAYLFDQRQGLHSGSSDFGKFVVGFGWGNVSQPETTNHRLKLKRTCAGPRDCGNLG